MAETLVIVVYDAETMKYLLNQFYMRFRAFSI